MRALVVVVVLLGGCLTADVAPCADGRICPGGTVCVVVADVDRCVFPDQLRPCVDAADGTECTVREPDDGVCLDGVCVEDGCGDGVRSVGEICDGQDLGEDVDGCTDVGFYDDGPVACLPDCTLDVSACARRCGDGVIDVPQEDCDPAGEPFEGDCRDAGYYEPGPLGCTPYCIYDVGACEGRCGDLELNGDELCDGAPPLQGECLDFGYDAGALTCTAFCVPGFEACGRIDWRRLDLDVTAQLFDAAGVAGDLFVVGASGVVMHREGAVWGEEPSGTTVRLNGVWGRAVDDVWAVGEAGTILRRTAAGWAAVTSPTTRTLHDVFGVGDEVYAVGDLGTIVRCTAGACAAVASGVTQTLSAVWGSGPTDVFVAGDAGRTLHFDGTSWTPQTQPNGAWVHGLWGSGPRDVWAATALGDVHHYDGVAWQDGGLGGAPLYDVWGSGPRDVYAVGAFGNLFHYDGVTWRTDVDPGALLLTYSAIVGTGPGDVIAVGQGGFVVASDGASWQPRSAVPSFPPLFSVWALSSTLAFGAGDEGAVARHDGLAWVEDASPTSQDLLGVWAAHASHAIAVGAGGVILRWNGSTWSTQASSTTANLVAVWGAGPSDVWAGGIGGVLLHFNGAAWSAQPSPTTDAIQALWGSGPDDIHLSDDAGGLFRYDGTQWLPQTSPTPSTLYELWGSAADDVYAVGGNVVLHFDGAAWSEIDGLLAGTWLHAWGTARDDVFLAGVARVLHFDGTSWAQVRSPLKGLDSFGALGGTARSVLGMPGTAGPIALRRNVRWACRAEETACGDGVDDDCDGTTDAADDDCDARIVLSELAGGPVDYVEVLNRGAEPSNLDGLTVTFRGGCSAQTYVFPPDALVAGDATFRVVDAATGMQARERHAGLDLCDTPDGGGWAALCAGPCDLVTCTNVLDYVAKSGVSSPVGAPSCATFTPAPVSVTGATAAQSLTRTGFAGGVASDWTVAPTSRD